MKVETALGTFHFSDPVRSADGKVYFLDWVPKGLVDKVISEIDKQYGVKKCLKRKLVCEGWVELELELEKL